MKVKKLLSTFAALAIAASSFAGLGISANAAYSVGLSSNTNYELTTTSGSVNSGISKTVDFSAEVAAVENGVLGVQYHVSTSVDYANIVGNRPGRISLFGKAGDADVVIADFYANTSKGAEPKKANYAIGKSVSSGNATWLSDTDHEFTYTIFVDLTNDEVWGTIKGENTNVIIPKTAVTIDTLKNITLESQSSANTMSLSSLVIKACEEYNPEVTTVTVSGADLIVVGGDTETYTSALADQAGEAFSGTVEYSLKEAATGVSINSATGVLTADDTASAGTVTVVATCGTVSGEKDVTVSADAAHVIKTTPYALIAIDGTTKLNSGATGEIELDRAITGEHSLLIEKEGYTSYTNEKADLSLNGTTEQVLTPAAGYSFCEDFANVNDTYGFDKSVSVANGVMSFGVTSGNDSNTTLGNVDLTDKVLHIRLKSRCGSNNNCGYIRFDGTGTKLYFYNKQIRLHGSDNNPTSWGNDAADYVDFDIIFSGSKASFYSNGQYVRDVNTTGTTLTGLSTEWAKGTFSGDIDLISVKTAPAAHLVKVVDGATTTSKTYLDGTSITLTAASSVGFKHFTDGVNTYDSGATVTITGAATYTAVYVPIIQTVAITTSDAALSTIGIPADTQELTAVTAGVENTTYAAISKDMTLTTVYIKVANPVDGVAPKLTVDGVDYQATYANIKDYNGYYVYQILAKEAVNISGATVTYNGATDYTVE